MRTGDRCSGRASMPPWRPWAGRLLRVTDRYKIVKSLQEWTCPLSVTPVPGLSDKYVDSGATSAGRLVAPLSSIGLVLPAPADRGQDDAGAEHGQTGEQHLLG